MNNIRLNPKFIMDTLYYILAVASCTIQIFSAFNKFLLC